MAKKNPKPNEHIIEEGVSIIPERTVDVDTGEVALRFNIEQNTAPADNLEPVPAHQTRNERQQAKFEAEMAGGKARVEAQAAAIERQRNTPKTALQLAAEARDKQAAGSNTEVFRPNIHCASTPDGIRLDKVGSQAV